jgi:prolyl-tRNA editing enzyme YbaK/EbsC (Cys-tRNA(Pro) deacylase)
VCVIVQYRARVNAEKVAKLFRENNGEKISRRQVNFQYASEETSNRLTGFKHNAVSPFGMQTAIPVVVSSAMLGLSYIWLGGGAADVKLRVSVTQCIQALRAVTGDVSEPRAFDSES